MMNRYSVKRLVGCLAGFFFLIPLANSQGSMGGMNTQINQIEAVETHLQQSRTQSSREAEDSAKKKNRVYESGKPATNTQGAKQKKLDSDSEKIKAPVGSSMKNN